MPSPPEWWPVSIEETGDGRVTIRYAYRDGWAGNIVVPATRHGEYDHPQLAGLLRGLAPASERPES